MENYYDELLKFIRENTNWKDLLSSEPYCINVKRCPYTKEDGTLKYPGLYMLSYTLVDIGNGRSDFFNPIVKACRGCIVDVYANKMVAVPFYKFANYGEPYMDDIDWLNSSVQEKIDGCLIKRFFYNDQWFWVTNNGWDTNVKLPSGIISRFEEQETDGCDTFQKLIDYAWRNYSNVDLDPSYTYMFELISPKNRIICDYAKTELCLLGARSKKTYIECNPKTIKLAYPQLEKMRSPEIYELNNIDEILDLCNSYKDAFHEGVVVCDLNFHRVKIKCQHYLEMKGFKGEIGFTNNKVLEAIRSGGIDDVLGAFPEVSKQVNAIEDVIKETRQLLHVAQIKALEMYSELKKIHNDERIIKKEFAKEVMGNFSNISSIMFNAIKTNYSFNVEITSWDYEKLEDTLIKLRAYFRKDKTCGEQQ